MQIVHYLPIQLPRRGYGGTERVAYWLGKAQAEMGHRVIFICKPGSEIPFGKTIDAPDSCQDLNALIPDRTDIVQLHRQPNFRLDWPFLVTEHGNGRGSKVFHPNTVFVSSNHAARHHWTEYVHNGIDLTEYKLETNKENSLLFLAKTSWIVKNLPGAIQIARQAGIPLEIAGGKAPFWSQGFVSHGIVCGAKKLELLQKAQALLFPVIWDEPFGIAVVEALACGTPVIATPRGALPEIIDSSCGVLADSLDALVARSQRSVRSNPKPVETE